MKQNNEKIASKYVLDCLFLFRSFFSLIINKNEKLPTVFIAPQVLELTAD
jgi:hypothetical protein